MRIDIKKSNGDIIFYYECESNTMRKTVERAVSENVSLDSANLSREDFSGAKLAHAIFTNADIRESDFSRADIEYADFSGAKAVKAIFSNANMYCTKCRETDFRYADFRGATFAHSVLIDSNLYNAIFRNTNLSKTCINYSNLRGADLSGAITDKRYIQVSCIGSRKGLTTYCFEDDLIWCGCFFGDLEKFEKTVKRVHGNNPQYLQEYMWFIDGIKKMKNGKEN